MLKKYTSKLSDNKKKIFANVFWAFTGKVINMAGALLVGILVARYLGPSQYGLMNYVVSYVTIFTIIATFGLDNIEIRELSKQPLNRDTVLGTTFRIRLFFALIAFLLIGATLWLFESDSYTSIMVLVYSSTVFSGCFNVIRNYFTSIVQNEYVVKSEILRTIIGALIKIALLWLKAPLTYFIIATAFDTVLVASGYIYAYHIKVGKFSDWKYDKTMVFFMLKESFPLVLSGAAVIIYQRIDQVMIRNMIDNESVGYFATASKFLDLIIFVPSVISQTLTPLLIRTKTTKPDIYKERLQIFFNLINWVSIIVVTLVSLLSYWIIYFTFGLKYMDAVPVLQIIAWKAVGTAMASSSGQVIVIEGIQKFAVIRNVVGCVVCVALNFALIPSFGIIGSAYAAIFTVFFSGYFTHYFIPQYRFIARMQTQSLLSGWRDLLKIKKILYEN
ncbi:flippase [uncultured Bacteroides sp.]|uniref:flippase n=1 Tax=uncultured Bacteroides sp. TaxID=162156 RepID=UPI002AA6D170|nr:flippase [uncultured Bacteroides sp.]